MCVKLTVPFPPLPSSLLAAIAAEQTMTGTTTAAAPTRTGCALNTGGLVVPIVVGATMQVTALIPRPSQTKRASDAPITAASQWNSHN